MPWPTALPPSGWLKCNGSPFDKSKYPQLALAYPAGYLPDLRGEFIRGWDDGRGIDSSRQLLSDQMQAVQQHDHETEIKTAGSPIQPPGNSYNVTLHAGTPAELDHYPWMAARRVTNSSANETRPRNIAFNYIVRAA